MDLALNINAYITERKLHIKHEIKKYTKGPHIDLKSIEAALTAREYLW